MSVTVKMIAPKDALSYSLILGVYEGKKLTPKAQEIDKLTKGFISKAISQFNFTAQINEILPLLEVDHKKFKNIILIGCGKLEKLTPSVFRRLNIAAFQALSKFKIKSVASYLIDLELNQFDGPWKVKQMTEAFYDAFYRFLLFKSQKNDTVSEPKLMIPVEDQLKDCQTALRQAMVIADSIIFSKNLANTPSNICTPSFLADQAKLLSKEYQNVKVKVLGENEMRRLNMGALLGVSQGSAEEAKLICLEYHGGKEKTIALVGKGITFDTGGNSIKPADSMVGMKYDMTGGAVVMACIKAAAMLELPISLIGIVAAAENMPGGTAYKPEDILTSMSGQTIEVLNTDAEGRLVLADALTYCEKYQPEIVIDIATLTGAVIIALGFHATGLLSNDEELASDLLKAGIESNDRAWQFPLWDEYQEQLKSSFADMSNVGGRPAGVITAACFLSRFAKKFRWAHLDVAGTAAMMLAGSERYATGRPIPLLMQFLMNQVKGHVA